MENIRTDQLDAYLAGELPEALEEAVETALRRDSRLREAFIDQARLDGALRLVMKDRKPRAAETKQFAEAVMARIEADETAGGGRGVAKSVLREILEEKEARRRFKGRMDWMKAGAVAAMAAGLAILVLQSVRLNGNREEDSMRSPEFAQLFVARLTDQNEAKWTRKSAADLAEDGWIRPGTLELIAGVAEVTFNSGARVFLEGPTVFEVERANRGFLLQGRLVAEVPRRASGFVVNTPQLNVVDLGTRFGVSVTPEGDSEVHVMEGVVEVSRLAGNAAPMVVNEGLAVRADLRTRSRLQVIEYEGDAFALRVREGTAPVEVPAVCYRFDESGGPEIENTGKSVLTGNFDASLLRDESDISRPLRSAGRIGGGLKFDQGDVFWARSPRGIAMGEAFTVAFWLRITPWTDSQSLPTVAAFSSDSDNWRIGWNQDPEAGKRGAVRVETGEGFLVGETDLRDGRWHHVGVRFLGGEDPVFPAHVHLYIDGKPDAFTGFRGGEIPGGSIKRIWLGGIGSMKPCFEGWLDEFFLFEGAVAPGVLQSLSEAGDLH